MTMYVIIIGGGKVGTYLATLLLEQNHRVRVIEQRREEMDRLRRDLPAEVLTLGSGTDPDLLETLGVRQANVVAAVTGADETNLVAASVARFEFRVPRIIARVNNPKNAWLFTPEMGVDVALNQAALMAHLVAEEMSLGDMMTLVTLRKGQFHLVQEKVHPSAVAVGKAIKDMKLPTDCVLAAVIRAGQMIIPHGDLVLQPVDEVVALVHASQAADLAALLSRAK
jgi:trk system potassium uptake protein